MSGRTPRLDRIASPQDLRGLGDAEYAALCTELRAVLVEAVARTGGHLAASLGAVELCVALHAVFNTPHDKLIWDGGHQSYAHKILTGRRGRMRTLRQAAGLSGYPSRSESEFDPFGGAHIGTSISAALGMATGFRRAARTSDAIAVIDDTALNSGPAFEALNHAGALGERLFVVLNDAHLQARPDESAMSAYLARLREQPPGGALREITSGMQAAMPGSVRDGARRARELVFGSGPRHSTFFEDIGWTYVGPLDGHDLNQLLPVLRAVRTRADGPILIHCATAPGAGYEPAARAPETFAMAPPFDTLTGKPRTKAHKMRPTEDIFLEALAHETHRDPRLITICSTQDVLCDSGPWPDALSDRVISLHAAEAHGVSFAAGLAISGLKPFCVMSSSHLQRAYDQIVHDVALQQLPVRFGVTQAGLAGPDGPSMAGSYDIAYLANLPDFVVMAPSDGQELSHMVATAAQYDDGPIALRIPVGLDAASRDPIKPSPIPLGKGRILAQGDRVALLSLGAHLDECVRARDELETRGISTTLADARFAKPLDTALIRQLARHHRALITIEQGAKGGFGAMVTHELANAGGFDRGLAVRCMCLPDQIIGQGDFAAMYAEAGLTHVDIVATALQALGEIPAKLGNL